MSELICALGPDSAGTVVTGLVRGARTSLDVAMYEVGPSYAWALARAAHEGVRVRVILDGHRGDGNAATAAAIIAAGGECRVLPRGAAAAHWKLLLVDGRVVATGTGNLIWRDLPRDAWGRLPPTAPLLRGTREWWA
ncbi:MAG: phospholipase D-like domain-containing protein, partial [Candidatus Dormibacteria bacterium]